MVEKIWNIIDKKISNPEYNIPFTNEIKVSEILKLLESYKQTYFNKNIFPSFQNQFEQNLFNTFRSYIEHKNYFII